MGGLVDLARPHQAHPVTPRGLRAARVPERDRILERPDRQRQRRKVEEPAALAGDLAARERALDDAQDVGEAVPGLRPVVTEPVVLDRDRAAAHAELQPPVRQLIDHAHVFDDPDRVVHRQQLDHRPEPDLPGHLRRGADEHLLARRHAQVAAVVLRQVVAGEAGLISHLDQRQPIFEQLTGRRSRDLLEVVKDSELLRDQPSDPLHRGKRGPRGRRATIGHGNELLALVPGRRRPSMAACAASATSDGCVRIRDGRYW